MPSDIDRPPPPIGDGFLPFTEEDEMDDWLRDLPRLRIGRLIEILDEMDKGLTVRPGAFDTLIVCRAEDARQAVARIDLSTGEVTKIG